MTADEVWRKSSRSNDNLNCVELSSHGRVRDSKNKALTLPVSATAWKAFLKEVQAGQLDH